MMSLAPYLPPTSGEAGAVFSLLQVLSDPAAAKKLLEKMVEERKAIENATEKQAEQFKQQSAQLSKERIENEKLKHTADSISSKAISDLNAAKTVLATAERRKTETEHMERQTAEQRVLIEERDKQLKLQEVEMTNRWHALQAREAAVTKNEGKLQQREDDLAMREKTLADDIAEHNKWLAGLKPPRAR